LSKPQLLLHIGSCKTGTTALQDTLAAQRQALAGKGILYHGWIDDGLNRNHSFLAALLANETGREPVTQFFADLAGECQRQRASRAIVSAEGFYALEFVNDTIWFVTPPLEPEAFRRSRREYIQRMRDCIGERFDTKVVVYLRRQDHFLNSLHNQLVKDVFAYTGTIGDFARDWGILGDYGLLLELWAEAFGAGALIVRIYEPHRALDIVPAFFTEILGLPAPTGDGLAAVRSSRGNQGLPPDLLEYKRILNRQFAGLSFEEKRKLRDDLMRLAAEENRGPKMLMSAAERRALLARYEESNRRVAKLYWRGSGLLFTEELPGPEAPPSSPLALSVERAVQIGVKLRLPDPPRPPPAAETPKETRWRRWRRKWFRPRKDSQPAKSS
jgi:hypothetical protein